MMPKMMEGGKEGGIPMMPQCVKVVFPNMPKEKRIDFVLEMVTTLVEQGSVGMSENEKKDFVAKMIEKVNA